ncbi:hypothetical protein LDENG_00109680, partial [Lucifuga dentata]
VKSLVQFSFFHLRNISKIRPVLQQKDLESVIHAFVISWLDDCNALFTCLSKSSVSRLQLVQTIDFKMLLLTHKGHGHGPVYLNELLCPLTSVRSLRSANQGYLAVLRSRLKTRGDGAFAVAAPHLWNGLPLREADSYIYIFKHI